MRVSCPKQGEQWEWSPSGRGQPAAREVITACWLAHAQQWSCDPCDGTRAELARRPQVVLHPAFGAPSAGMLAWTWACVACASAGLALLYKTTVADPGFLPLGPQQPRNGAARVRLPCL